MIEQDIEFMRSILPDTYTVTETSTTKGSIHCVSSTGIFKHIDAEDNEHWEYVFKAIQNYFKERFSEVYHITCFNHVNFIVYLKVKK